MDSWKTPRSCESCERAHGFFGNGLVFTHFLVFFRWLVTLKDSSSWSDTWSALKSSFHSKTCVWTKEYSPKAWQIISKVTVVDFSELHAKFDVATLPELVKHSKDCRAVPTPRYKTSRNNSTQNRMHKAFINTQPTESS